MDFMKQKNKLAYLGLILASLSLTFLGFVKWHFVFESGNVASVLVSIVLVTGIIGLVLGILTTPRWQAIVTLFIVAVVAYFVLFTQLYGLN